MLLTRERTASTQLVVPVLGTAGHRVLPVDGRKTVTDYTRPLLLGYVQQDLLPPEHDANRMERVFEAFARVEGFAMGSVYSERRLTAPAAFTALMESIRRYEVTAVVIPGWQHLELVGDPGRVKQEFERVTGARLLLYDPGP